ncbi:hypothetical protein ACFPTY_12200 [Halomonas beimenensis]|uniref:Uncharacterized protein n=1 Tax=Halomonas beimenensis TaxID=475662 RepID=A0A291PA89_9GAMM|nr:hypothetical protein BEI_2791 [Halomonas beimenensis]
MSTIASITPMNIVARHVAPVVRSVRGEMTVATVHHDDAPSAARQPGRRRF